MATTACGRGVGGSAEGRNECERSRCMYEAVKRKALTGLCEVMGFSFEPKDVQKIVQQVNQIKGRGVRRRWADL